jgi:undecaprenyl diphosphate synthase
MFLSPIETPVGLYDRYLAFRTRLHDAPPPAHVALVITERDLLEPGAFDTLEAFLRWTFEYGAERTTVYVSVLDPEAIAPLRRSLTSLETPHDVALHDPANSTATDAPIQIGVGLGGKHEFTEAVRSLAAEVEDGSVAPADLDGDAIESELVFPTDPDLVIKTGAERLSDFMIWQSVYSELYFTDLNWQNVRRRDYLRAIYEFKRRTRRFGR